MDTISTQKKFSSRINYGALEALGLAKEEMGGLQSFDDEKEDEKYDEGKEYDDEEGKEGESAFLLRVKAELTFGQMRKRKKKRTTETNSAGSNDDPV
jgi:hypothetical protein